MKICLALVTALGLVSSLAAAQTAPNYLFDTVDSYRINGDSSSPSKFSVTGVIHGQSAPSSVTFLAYTASADACERQLIQMVNRPGRFTLGVFTTAGVGNMCELTRTP